MNSALINNIIKGYQPNIEEMKQLLRSNSEETAYLYNAANKVREYHCGNKVEIRAIVEFSNYCSCNCSYCGLNIDNKKLQRYRMGLDEIIQVVKEAYEAGYKTVVLQSGEDRWFTTEHISSLIKSIKKEVDIAITLSVGERPYEDYVQWYRDGVDRFLMKHETASMEHYNSLHPHSSFINRMRCLTWLKQIGYQIGSGFMIGLPGQSEKDIARDILLLNKLKTDMAGIGPFISHPDTKLGNQPNGSVELTLKAIAITRILLKTVHLPATTALLALSKDSFRKAFRVGANVIMQKIEPIKYRRLYNIYPNSMEFQGTIKEERSLVEVFVEEMDREVSVDKGHSLTKGRRKDE